MSEIMKEEQVSGFEYEELLALRDLCYEHTPLMREFNNKIYQKLQRAIEEMRKK